MASLDSRHAGPFTKAGPPDAPRNTFTRSLRSLPGEALLLAGSLTVYLAAVAALYAGADKHVRGLVDDLGPLPSLAVLAVPLACIVLFQLIPVGLRVLRERRLRAMAAGGPQGRGGPFRLHPFTASDRDAFSRLDGADHDVLAFVKSADAPVLYLSGASGVGKSSLLSAAVLPRLRDEGWTVVETQVSGDPAACLRQALVTSERLAGRLPAGAAALPPLALVTVAAAAAHGAPLLIVVDPFDEFLVSGDETARAAFAALLTALSERPIDGLRLLLVLRSDCLPLVGKLGFPPLRSGGTARTGTTRTGTTRTGSTGTWHQLAAYDRRTAASLLAGGGAALPPAALDTLFAGLDRIEEAPGLYRPVTLNLIGLALEGRGGRLRLEATGLLRGYLDDAMSAGASRDFARPVLAAMAAAGAREPLSEAELGRRTHLQAWQVRATLADLARRGLVRRLRDADGGFAIASDFLARTIGQATFGHRVPLARRVRPLVAPAVVVGWVGVFVLGLPVLRDVQEQAAKRTLGELFDARIYTVKPQGSAVVLRNADEPRLTRATPYLDRVDGLALDLSNTRITSLEPLRGLTGLSSLDVTSTAVGDLAPLASLPGLSSLSAGNTRVTTLAPLAGLTRLSSLDFSFAPGIASLEPLARLAGLSSLDITLDDRVTSLEPLRHLTGLSSLSLSRTGITSLEPLSGLTRLSTLTLASTDITDLSPLARLTRLSRLDLSSTGITDLSPLHGLASLSWLDLSSTGVTDLSPLRGLPNLSSVNLTGTAVTTLAPLAGTQVLVVGANEQLRATMK